MGKTISFWWDAEKRIRVARAGEQDSLFYEAYRQALAGVAEIIRASVMQTRNYDSFFPQSERDELRITCDSQYLYDYPNNIIVFSGERGAGKSSAMLTFVNSLKDKDGLLFKDEFLSGMVACELPNAKPQMVKQMLQTCSFADLAPIDPTTLEDNGQILTVILARMFQLATTTWESVNVLRQENSAQRQEEKNRLVQKFSTCYEHIQAIKKSGETKPEYDGVETLAELGDSSRLKVELYELVKQLLEFCLPEAGDSSYLVLQIDDTDMNIKKAYAILEDVRRYLVIPRLIIVMAADLKHLEQVVESSLLKDYDEGLDSRREYVEKITHQYITKLFPQTRQIDLPALGTYLKEHMESITIRYQIPGNTILPDKKENQFPSSQDQIFRLIYQKTGMVFLKQEHRLHPIIPCNMRLLAHFLSMLIQMEDVDDPDAENPSFFLKKPDSVNTYEAHAKKLRTRLQNIQRFRNYFLTTWVNNSLDNKSVQLFKDLEQIDVADRIRYICVRLSKRVESKKFQDPKPNGKHLAGHCRYADMVRICEYIAGYAWDEELKRLSFALQTYCSLFAQTLALEELIDYYDDLAEMERKAAAKETGSDEEEEEGAAQYPSKDPGLGCSFSKLYVLFGSQLFPYPQKDDKQNVTVKFPGNDTCKNPEELKIAWKLEDRNSLSAAKASSNVTARQYATLLYSMLADYQPPEDDGDIWFDLTKPIINCLYLGDKNGMTPFSEAVPGAASLNLAVVGDDSWYKMGNSALITVLNFDVQARINAALQRWIAMFEREKPGTGESTDREIDYNDWITYVNDMYTAMKESLGAPCPIHFLEKMDFFQWLEPVSTKGVEDSEDWKAIIESLGAGITYTAPPAKDEKNLDNPASPKKTKDSSEVTFEILISKDDKPDKPK